MGEEIGKGKEEEEERMGKEGKRRTEEEKSIV